MEPAGNRRRSEPPKSCLQSTLRLLGNKWCLQLLQALYARPHRSAELRRAIPGLSAKVQTQQLRRLERAGLVARSIHASVPPRVDYALTPRGRSLAPLVLALDAWARDPR